MAKKEKIESIISKVNWQALLQGATKTLRLYDESELHHFFGDYPDKEIIRIQIVDKG